ncbi:MAG: hypothetical protein HY077_18545 [Elusimicrobia bacterium]|nr:hypothetical protein [Elusimicrobiota bacterium]
MLEFLLRHVTVRNLVIAGILGASLPFAVGLGRSAREFYRETYYPAQRGSNKGSDDIKKTLDQRESEKVIARFERVNSRLAQAKADGRNIGGLAWKSKQAMRYNVPGRRDVALQMLDEVEMATPLKKVQYIPLYPPAPKDMMSDDDVPPAKAAAAKGKAAGAAKKKSKKHAKKKPRL